MKSIITPFIFMIILSLGCINRNKNDEDKASINIVNLDTPVDSLKKWAVKAMGFDDIGGADVIEIKKDTLKIISTAKFIYYPFGKFTNIESLISKYPLLQVSKTYNNSDSTELFKTSYKTSYFKFVNSTETRFLEIVYAKILDPEISFDNGIKVGMSTNSLYSIFFSRPVKLSLVKNVKIVSALDGINHVYEINKGRVSRIVMDSDYLYDKD